MHGLDGNDTITAGTGPTTIHGGPGNDTLRGGPTHDHLHGEDGNDKLYGNNGNDTLVGGAGDDYLDGGAGADTYVLSTGNDTIADTGNDSIVTMPPGLAPQDVTVTRTGNLLLTHPEGSVTFQNWYVYAETNKNYPLAYKGTFQFDDGTTWDRETIENDVRFTITGTDDDD
ncbi:calcium-binding protein, partial [Cellulomonas sp. IC4_254]|uniref:calcium-binding protein n=1 Tax=Cellulomonas sp. IC4_254 TaxID=2714040 RepID=UPI0023F99378